MGLIIVLNDNTVILSNYFAKYVTKLSHSLLSIYKSIKSYKIYLLMSSVAQNDLFLDISLIHVSIVIYSIKGG